MKRIHVIILVALMGLSFYIGYYVGDTNSEVVESPHVIDSVVAVNKKLAAHILWNNKEMTDLYASLKQDSVNIIKLKSSAIVLKNSIDIQKKEFAKEIEKVRGASLAKLDSFRWARYPDSVTCAKRYQQLQYENY